MKIIILFFLLIPALLFGQDSLFKYFPLVNGKITYEKIIQIDGLKKDQIFIKLKDWASQTYVSQKATLDVEDKDGGYLVYKGYLPCYLFYKGGLLNGKKYVIDVFHTIRFYIKDFKMKIIVTDLESRSHDVTSEYIAEKYYRQIEKIPIENWGANESKKKQQKLYESRTQDAFLLDLQISSFILSVKGFVLKKDSQSNF